MSKFLFVEIYTINNAYFKQFDDRKYHRYLHYHTHASLENIHEANKLLGFEHYTISNSASASNVTPSSDIFYTTPELKTLIDKDREEKIQIANITFALVKEINQTPKTIKTWDFGDGFKIIMERVGDAKCYLTVPRCIQQNIVTRIMHFDKQLSTVWGFYAGSYITLDGRAQKKQFIRDYRYIINNPEVTDAMANKLKEIYQVYKDYKAEWQIYNY